MKKGDKVRLNVFYYGDPYAYHDDYKSWCARKDIVWHEINDSEEQFKAVCLNTVMTLRRMVRKGFSDSPIVYVTEDEDVISAAPYFEHWLDVVEVAPKRSYTRKQPEGQERLL